MKRRPSRATLGRFYKLWHEAQERKDVIRMNTLLSPKYLNYWWHLMESLPRSQPSWETSKAAVENILQRMDLIGMARPQSLKEKEVA